MRNEAAPGRFRSVIGVFDFLILYFLLSQRGSKPVIVPLKGEGVVQTKQGRWSVGIRCLRVVVGVQGVGWVLPASSSPSLPLIPACFLFVIHFILLEAFGFSRLDGGILCTWFFPRFYLFDELPEKNVTWGWLRLSLWLLLMRLLRFIFVKHGHVLWMHTGLCLRVVLMDVDDCGIITWPEKAISFPLTFP